NVANDLTDLAANAQFARISLNQVFADDMGAEASAAALGSAAFNKALKAASAGPKLPAVGPGSSANPNLDALDRVLNPEKDKKSLEAAKKRLAKMLPDLFKAAQKLVKNIGDKSISSIESGFDSLIGKYRAAIEVAVEVGNKTVAARLRTNLKLVQNFEKQLIKV